MLAKANPMNHTLELTSASSLPGVAIRHIGKMLHGDYSPKFSSLVQAAADASGEHDPLDLVCFLAMCPHDQACALKLASSGDPVIGPGEDPARASIYIFTAESETGLSND